MYPIVIAVRAVCIDSLLPQSNGRCEVVFAPKGAAVALEAENVSHLQEAHTAYQITQLSTAE